MNAVIGLTELVLKSQLAPQQSEYLKLVLESAESLLNIINDILDFTKIEAGKMLLAIEPFWLRDCLVDALGPGQCGRGRHKDLRQHALDERLENGLLGRIARVERRR